MRILLTGGAGFIGSNLAFTLQARRDNITIVDDLSSGDLRNLKGFKGGIVVANIASLDLSSKFDGIDLIFHQASITDTTITDPRRMEINVEGLKNVLDFAVRQKSKVIYASSAGVYGNGKVPMKEAQELYPLNCYAFSKCTMDNLAMRYTREYPETTIIGLRYFNVFGPNEQYKGKSSSMVYQLGRQMLQKKSPRLFKHGEQKRDHIYVKDVVTANIKAIEVDKSGIVNIGTGVTTSFNDIVRILNGVLGTSFESQYFDNPYSFYQNETQADFTKARKLLGFEPQYSLEEGIADYFEQMDTCGKAKINKNARI